MAIYDINYRAKLNRNFSRDLDFLDAILNKDNTFKGIIIDKIIENEYIKIKIYIPKWKRIISSKYKYINENIILSRDEKREIDISMYKELEIKCTFNINSNYWKDRIVINII